LVQEGKVLILHSWRRGCLALGVLLGALFLPGEARAIHKLPSVPALEHVRKLLIGPLNPNVFEAVEQVNKAIVALGGPKLQGPIAAALTAATETTHAGSKGRKMHGKGAGAGATTATVTVTVEITQATTEEIEDAKEAKRILRDIRTQLEGERGRRGAEKALFHIHKAMKEIEDFIAQPIVAEVENVSAK
jgi:hypothetical protein